MSVDQKARQEIRAAVDDFIAGTNTAFELDERLWAIETEDATAREVIDLLWCTYDDLKDHGAEHWDKQTWDVVQRCLLALDAGVVFETTSRRVWHLSQIPALLGPIAIIWMCCLDAFSLLVAGIWIALAGLSWGVCQWRGAKAAILIDPAYADTFPFSSVGDIKLALHRVSGWRKRRHHGRPASRLRSPVSVSCITAIGYLSLGPLLLFGFMTRLTETRTRALVPV